MADEAIIGRRASDGDFVSFREAVKIFATKDELEGMSIAMKTIGTRVDNLPTRHEIELYLGRHEDQVATVGVKLDVLDQKVTTLTENRLPKWVLPAGALFTAIVMPIMIIVISHFWIVPVPGK